MAVMPTGHRINGTWHSQLGTVIGSECRTFGCELPCPKIWMRRFYTSSNLYQGTCSVEHSFLAQYLPTDLRIDLIQSVRAANTPRKDWYYQNLQGLLVMESYGSQRVSLFELKTLACSLKWKEHIACCEICGHSYASHYQPHVFPDDHGVIGTTFEIERLSPWIPPVNFWNGIVWCLCFLIPNTSNWQHTAAPRVNHFGRASSKSSVDWNRIMIGTKRERIMSNWMAEMDYI